VICRPMPADRLLVLLLLTCMFVHDDHLLARISWDCEIQCDAHAWCRACTLWALFGSRFWAGHRSVGCGRSLLKRPEKRPVRTPECSGAECAASSDGKQFLGRNWLGRACSWDLYCALLGNLVGRDTRDGKTLGTWMLSALPFWPRFVIAPGGGLLLPLGAGPRVRAESV